MFIAMELKCSFMIVRLDRLALSACMQAEKQHTSKVILIDFSS